MNRQLVLKIFLKKIKITHCANGLSGFRGIGVPHTAYMDHSGQESTAAAKDYKKSGKKNLVAGVQITDPGPH